MNGSWRRPRGLRNRVVTFGYLKQVLCPRTDLMYVPALNVLLRIPLFNNWPGAMLKSNIGFLFRAM